MDNDIRWNSHQQDADVGVEYLLDEGSDVCVLLPVAHGDVVA